MRYYVKYSILIVCILLVKSRSTYAQNFQGVKGQKPFVISGNLSVTTQFYAVNGIENRRQPFTWYLNGSPTIKIYGLSIPFTFAVSEQERSFSQPFNRYGASPYYKWVKLHIGYRNVRFSDFTLGGANFLGGGIELTPKNFRFAFVYGQFKRRVFEDSSGNDPRYSYLRPTYQRLGYGGKIGIGKPKAYLDVSFFKGEDVVESIPTPSLRSGVRPMANLSAGVKAHFGILKNKLLFDVDLGASLLTRDIGQTDIKSNVQWQNTVLKIIAINSSSAFFKALKGSSSYSHKKGSIRIDYQRIDPDYQSLGAYFFQNDVEQITVSPSVRLLKGKINVSGSLGRSRDNLNGKKSATTHRNVSALGLNASLSNQLNLNLNYSNFGLGQSRGIGDIFNDSLAVSVVNSSYSGNLNYARSNKQVRHNLGLFATFQNTNDQNQFTRQYATSSSFISSLSYSYGLVRHKLNFNLSANYVAMHISNMDISTYGPSLNVSKEWMKGKIRTSLNQNSQFRRNGKEGSGLMNNSGANISVRHKKQSIGIRVNYLKNSQKNKSEAQVSSTKSFSETRGSISYGIRF